MRKILFILPLILAATPAAAQPARLQVPPQLTDPETIIDVSIAAQQLSDAIFDMNVGTVKAAVEGHDPTPAERRMTVRQLARQQDPNFDRDVHNGIASVGPTLMRTLAAVNRALPAVKQAVDQAQASIDRISANVPDPTYPRR